MSSCTAAYFLLEGVCKELQDCTGALTVLLRILPTSRQPPPHHATAAAHWNTTRNNHQSNTNPLEAQTRRNNILKQCVRPTSNTIYCNIIFANRIESLQKVKSYSRRFQTPPHPTIALFVYVKTTAATVRS